MTEALSNQSKTLGLDKQGLEIFADYSDNQLPVKLWELFFSYGGFEKLYNLSSTWVSIQKSLVTQNIINQYRNQGKKILIWDLYDNQDPFMSQADAILLWK